MILMFLNQEGLKVHNLNVRLLIPHQGSIPKYFSNDLSLSNKTEEKRTGLSL